MLTVHAYIEVTDLERGIAFYRDALGLTLKRRLRPFDLIEFASGGYAVIDP